MLDLLRQCDTKGEWNDGYVDAAELRSNAASQSIASLAPPASPTPAPQPPSHIANTFGDSKPVVNIPDQHEVAPSSTLSNRLTSPTTVPSLLDSDDETAAPQMLSADGRSADGLSAGRPTASTPLAPLSPVAPSSPPAAMMISGDGLENFLVDFVVEQTGYPREIIEMDADFEADLGIDSIKKAQLFGELREHFSLDMSHFESIDRSTFGDIKTLEDIKTFLQNIPQVNEGIMAKVVDASVVEPSPVDSSPLRGTNVVPPPMQLQVTPPERTMQSSIVPKVAATPVTTRPAAAPSERQSSDADLQQAYQQGCETGLANAEQIKKSLLNLVSQRNTSSVGLTAQGAREFFGELAFSEMRGIADGAGVHVGNVVSYNYAATIASRADDAAGSSQQMSSEFLDCQALLSRSTRQSVAELETTEVTQSAINIPPAALTQPTASNSSKPQDQITSRFVLRTAAAPQRIDAAKIPQLSGDSIIIGANPVAMALQNKIRQLGFKAHCIEPTDDHDAAIARLDEIWGQGVAPHLFIVSPRDEKAQLTGDWTQWRDRRSKGIMLPFWFCRAWLQKVQQEKLMDDASLLAVISSGGDLGFHNPIHSVEGGGVSGLMKAILIEIYFNGYRTTPVKVLDAKPDESPEAIATAVFSELANPSYDTESSWNNGARSRAQAHAEELPVNLSPQVVERGSHWVCTGGARGITAYVSSGLAKRYGLKLSLIGTRPRPEIPPAWHSLDDKQQAELKRTVMTEARDRGENPIQAWAQTEKTIEIDQTLRALEQDGVSVRYYHCDVADPPALEAVLEQSRSDHGPIDAVLHGAGIGRDSSYEKKQPAIVDQCIGAKVDGALALMKATCKDPLKHFIAFGSISGRFGANGNTDYALANEMLAKTVGWYQSQRPEVKSVTFHWHAWDDIGLAVKPEIRLGLEMVGMQFMPAKEGLEHVIRELEAGCPEREVLITDDRYYRQFFPMETRVSDTSQAPRYPMLKRGADVIRDGVTMAAVPLVPDEDPFLKEHRLDDKPLLPIVIGLELLAEAGARRIGSSDRLEIRDIEATNGLKFHSSAPITAHVIADLRQDGAKTQSVCELVADFYSRNGKLVEQNRSYLRGTVAAQSSPQQTSQPFRPATPVPEGEWHSVEYPKWGSKFYAGPTLQRLKKIKVQGKTVWGTISAPAIVELAGNKHDVDGWLIPSSALDACLFATGLLAWFAIEPGSALPSAIGRLSLGRRAIPGELLTVESTFKRREDRYAWFDFSLYGSDGSSIVEVEDYRIVWLSE